MPLITYSLTLLAGLFCHVLSQGNPLTAAFNPNQGPAGPGPAAGALVPKLPPIVTQFMGMSIHDICATLTLKGTGAQSDALDTIIKHRFPNASVVTGFRNRSNPMEYKQMFGSGPWACAFDFYAARNPLEVAGAFSDLVDGAGCNIVCDKLRGPRKIGVMGMLAAMNGGPNPMGPMANPLAALGNLMSGMGNPMGGMGNPMNGMGNPMNGMGNPTGGMGNPMASMGNPTGGMGNPTGGMGNPMASMGNPTGGMGNPMASMGNPTGGMGNLMQNPSSKSSAMGNGRPQGQSPNNGHQFVPPFPQPPRGNRWGQPGPAALPFPDPSTQNAAPWVNHPFQITPPQQQPQQQHHHQQHQPQPASQPQPTQVPFHQQMSQIPPHQNHFPSQGPSPFQQPPHVQPHSQPLPPQQQQPQQPTQTGLSANMPNLPPNQDPQIAPHLSEAMMRMPAPQRTQFLNDAITAFFGTLGIQLSNPQQQANNNRAW